METKALLRMMLLVIYCLTSYVLVSCDNDDKPDLKVSTDKVEVTAGKTVTVTVSGGTAPYTVISSDVKIATAMPTKNAITITGIKEGSVIITITDRKRFTGKVAVTVKENPKTPKELNFDKQSITMNVGKDGLVAVKGGTMPYSAVVKDNKIATVSVKEDKISVRGIKAGTTTVTITDKNKKVGTINVTIK